MTSGSTLSSSDSGWPMPPTAHVRQCDGQRAGARRAASTEHGDLGQGRRGRREKAGLTRQGSKSLASCEHHCSEGASVSNVPCGELVLTVDGRKIALRVPVAAASVVLPPRRVLPASKNSSDWLFPPHYNLIYYLHRRYSITISPDKSRKAAYSAAVTLPQRLNSMRAIANDVEVDVSRVARNELIISSPRGRHSISFFSLNLTVRRRGRSTGLSVPSFLSWARNTRTTRVSTKGRCIPSKRASQ